MTSCALTIKECHKPCLFRLIILVRYYVLSRPSTSRSLNCRFPSVLTEIITIIVSIIVVTISINGHHVMIIIIYQLVRRSFCILFLFCVCRAMRIFRSIYRLPPETHTPGLFSSNGISGAAWVIAFIDRLMKDNAIALK